MAICDYIRDIPLLGSWFCSEPEVPTPVPQEIVDPNCKPGCHSVAKDSEKYASSICGAIDQATASTSDRCVDQRLILDMYLCECAPDVELSNICRREGFDSLQPNYVFAACCVRSGDSCFTD